MTETDWLPGLIVLGIGLLGGLALAWTQSKNQGGGQPGDGGAAARREDLVQRKAELLAALRDLEDTDGARGVQEASRERRRLETEAAKVFKALDELGGGTPGPGRQGANMSLDKGGDGAPKAAPSGGSEWRGAIKGGLAVGFVALLVFALQMGTTERVGDMGPTGKAPIVASGSSTRAGVPAEGQPGGPVPGLPPNLQPKASPAVNSARAGVAAQPESPDAWANLGYALLDAEGWIDAFEASRKVLELSPGHPDGLTVQASVRVVMGQLSDGAELLDQALAKDPQHVTALSYRGMVAWREGDAEAAKGFWERAKDIAGPGAGFEDLIAMADGGPPPAKPPSGPSGGGAGAMPPGHPQAGGAPTAMPPGHPPAGGLAGGMPAGHPPAGGVAGGMPAGHPSAAPGSGAVAATAEVSGTLELAEGATPPPGGALFVFVRPVGVDRGPPTRVKRLAPGPLPRDFAITASDVMMGASPFPASASLTARWDADGNVMSKSPEDLVASAQVSEGATGVKLVLAPAN